MNDNFRLQSLSALFSKYLSDIEHYKDLVELKFKKINELDESYLTEIDSILEKLAISKIKYDTLHMYYNNLKINSTNMNNNVDNIDNGKDTDLIDFNFD